MSLEVEMYNSTIYVNKKKFIFTAKLQCKYVNSYHINNVVVWFNMGPFFQGWGSCIYKIKNRPQFFFFSHSTHSLEKKVFYKHYGFKTFMNYWYFYSFTWFLTYENHLLKWKKKWQIQINIWDHHKLFFTSAITWHDIQQLSINLPEFTQFVQLNWQNNSCNLCKKLHNRSQKE